MSEAVVSTAKGKEHAHDESDSLLPHKNRIMDRFSYFLAWFGGCVSIATFTVGSSLVGKLSLLQAILAIAIGCFIIGLGLTINGAAGYKTGIPFVVQLRSAFGFRGTNLPGMIRAVPAIVWYGFQSWIGAGALNVVSTTLFGYNNLVLHFIIFQLLQIALSVTGFKGIKWLENLGSGFILLSLIYMFYSVITRYGGELSDNLLTVKGTWGLPFWGATMLFLGVYSTMMLNVSDYARELRPGTGGGLLTTIYAFSILPATIFMGLIGLMVSSATGVSDPVQVFSTAVDNTPLLVTTLLFIAFAQVTTNVLNNVIPPTYVLMDVFKLKFKTSAIIVGLLAFATFPWELVKESSSTGLQVFIQIYSAFLGPIFSVMVVDYYLIRKRKPNLEHLYNQAGPYRGWNWAGVIAVAAGLVFAAMLPKISWYASLVPAGVAYYLAMKYLKPCRRFNQ